MGEIIIKISEDVKEVIELNVPYEKVKEKLEELEKEEKKKFLENFTNKYLGKLDISNVKEEELYG